MNDRIFGPVANDDDEAAFILLDPIPDESGYPRVDRLERHVGELLAGRVGS